MLKFEVWYDEGTILHKQLLMSEEREKREEREEKKRTESNVTRFLSHI